MTRKKTLYLVDGSAMFYRAYFAFIRNPLINSKGEDTSATFGYVNSLLKIIDTEQPDYIAVAFDTKHPTFRHDMYPEYKATREKMPEELVVQLPRIKQATDALNIFSFEQEGFEADDIIGTLAKEGEKAGLEVFLVTGDKDFFQLVSENVTVYNPKSSNGEPEKYDREGVKKKFGVYPELVIDKLALMGDSSDNVPGIPGIGPKTADKLLEQFGSLEDTLDKCDEIKANGVRKKVTENKESAVISKKLVIIKTDMPLAFTLDDLQRKEYNYELSKELFMELEFGRILKQVTGEAAVTEEVKKEDQASEAWYHTVTTIDELRRLVKALKKEKEIAVDTETTSVNALQAELVGVSLSSKAGSGYYIPLAHSTDKDHNLPMDESLEVIKDLLEDPKVQKFGQNIKYDLQVFHRYGIDIEPIGFDTMLAAYVIEPTGRDKSLDLLALKHFDYKMMPISELIGSGKNQKTFDIVPIETATFYAAEDADYTYRLRGVLAPQLQDLDMHNLYYNIELPLIKVLADMEESGIKIDVAFLKKLSKKMEKQLSKLISEIYEIAGGEFNINSTQQLSHILFDKLGLPTKGKTAKKTGYSTDVKVLEELGELHELPKLILEYRQLTKLKNTYIDAIPKLVNPETNRVHTSFNQTIAATGRLSSTDPNLQNIPVRTEAGREIRKAFIPKDKDHTLLVADYSQVELRIMAHYAKDKSLVEAFKHNEDIHRRTAAEVFDVALEDVTDDMRRTAKTANFAIIYGVSAFGLSQQTGMTVAEAKEFIETYFDRYPGINKYMDNMKKQAKEKGFVMTHFKRRRYLPEIKSKNFNMRQFAERIAINTPIQGTAADMIKIAMIDIHKKMAGMKSKMLLQVHDELIFDAYTSELEKLKKIVKSGMEKAVKLTVPITVEMEAGESWLDAK